MSNLRCSVCDFEASEDRVGADRIEPCPNCGGEVPLSDASYDVTIKTNWHVLRCLIIWAENWAMQNGAGTSIVYAEVDRIKSQHPEFAEEIPLTIADDLAKMRDAGLTISSTFPGVEGVSISREEMQQKLEDMGIDDAPLGGGPPPPVEDD
jgi:hypothetical protein